MVVGGQSKVGKLAGHSIICDENVLRLEIPVVDSNGVAVVYSIQDLEESPLGKSVITDILSLLGDVGEEITLRAVLDDHEGAVRRIQNLYQRNYVGMGTGLMMELDLSLLKLLLTGLQT